MGQLASNLGNPNVTDPRQARPGDLDPNEKAARLIAGGTQGLARGFQDYQGQQQAQRQVGALNSLQTPSSGAAPVSSDYFNPQRKLQGNNLAFYGGS